MTIEIDGIQVNGSFHGGFERTIREFAANFAEGRDVGASYALSLEGEMVVDVWAGHQDAERTVPWEKDTICNVYSSTKTVTFLCALVLADRGELDFDAPVSKYWPEFAQNGKEHVLVWHLMSHAAGLSGMDVPVSQEDCLDWDKMVGLLAEQAPWWEPGSASGYHATTQGYLVGEVVRRITGKTIGAFLRDEIAGPLKADFHIGVPDSEFHRVCNLLVPEGTNDTSTGTDEGSIAHRTFTNPFPRAEMSWTDAWRRAEMPASGGHGNARALARLQTVLANGGQAFGVNLMSSATAQQIMVPRISGEDLVLGVPISFGLGFGLNDGPIPMSPNANACYWGGWGGSSVLIDQDARVSMSYVMNQMFPGLLGDTRAYNIREQAFKDLAELG